MRRRQGHYIIESIEGRRLLSAVLNVRYSPPLSATTPITLDSPPSAGAQEAELSIAVDPTNSANLAAASKTTGTEWWSTNGGSSWSSVGLPNFYADPSVAFDSAGRLLISYLSASVNGLGIQIVESTTHGSTLSVAASVSLPAPDKDWLAVGPNPSGGGAVYVTYTDLNDMEKVHVLGWQENSSGALSLGPRQRYPSWPNQRLFQRNFQLSCGWTTRATLRRVPRPRFVHLC